MYRVWWIPQVPMNPFYVLVESVEQGVRVMDILADYDLFQFENKIKPDYTNMGGVQVFEGGEWCDWYDEETGDDAREYVERIKGTATPTE